MELKQALIKLKTIDWELDPIFNIVRLEQYGYKLIGKGSDKDVYETPIENILLKTTIGRQKAQIPKNWSHLFLPILEFKLPQPVRAGNDEEIKKHLTRIHYWGQLQLKCILPEINNIYLEDIALDQFVYGSCMNKDFIQALIDCYNYSSDEIKSFISDFQEAGLGAVSSKNWGYLNEKPIIFDVGVIEWSD